MDNNKVLKALHETLDEYGIPKHLYSINKEKKETVVIIKRSTCWVVYDSKSNNSRDNVSLFLTCEKACFELIKRVCFSEKQEEFMIDTFLTKIKNNI